MDSSPSEGTEPLRKIETDLSVERERLQHLFTLATPMAAKDLKAFLAGIPADYMPHCPLRQTVADDYRNN